MNKLFTLDGKVVSTRELLFDNQGDADVLAWIEESEIGDVYPSFDCELARVA